MQDQSFNEINPESCHGPVPRAFKRMSERNHAPSPGRNPVGGPPLPPPVFVLQKWACSFLLILRGCCFRPCTPHGSSPGPGSPQSLPCLWVFIAPQGFHKARRGAVRVNPCAPAPTSCRQAPPSQSLQLQPRGCAPSAAPARVSWVSLDCFSFEW